MNEFDDVLKRLIALSEGKHDLDSMVAWARTWLSSEHSEKVWLKDDMGNDRLLYTAWQIASEISWKLCSAEYDTGRINDCLDALEKTHEKPK